MKKFIEVVHEYMVYDAKENKYSTGTKEKKAYQFNHLVYFLYSSGIQNLCADEIKVRHMMLYKEWLRDNTSTKSNEHISRHIRFCSSAMNYAVCMDYADSNRIMSMELKKDPPKEIICLEPHEIILFEGYRSERLTWQMAVDFYLFLIYTGISYMDLWLFDVTKEKMFYKSRIITLELITCFNGRGKNGQLYWAEFIPKARGIWEKYNRELPFIHDQTFNNIIKKVAKELGINKNLTTHTGRKTFCNVKDDEGYSLGSITKMVGNTQQVMLKHYLKKNKKSLLLEILEKKYR